MISLKEANLYESIGKNVRAARRSAKLTQGELAAQAGLKRTSITNLEKGQQKTPVHVLFRIAAALDIQPVKLLPELNEVLFQEESPGELVTVGEKVEKVTPRAKEIIEQLKKTKSSSTT